MKKLNNVINTKLIERYLKDNGLSKSRFCIKCGICIETYNKVIKNENVKLTSIFKMSKTMGLPINKLFK